MATSSCALLSRIKQDILDSIQNIYRTLQQQKTENPQALFFVFRVWHLFYFFIYSPYFSWLRVCVTHKACIQQQPEHLLPLSDSLSTAFSRSTKTPGKEVTRIQKR